jgi:hypothetical protein
MLLPMADLKAQWEMKGKKELLSLCQNTRRNRGETYYKNGSSPCFHINMNRRALVWVNLKRAGHSCLEASLSRFNNVSTANFRMMTSCKRRYLSYETLYEGQRATVTDILTGKGKKKNTEILLQSS